MENFIAITAGCGALGGLTVLLVGYIFLVVSAFGCHVLWGLSLMFVWPLSILFSIKHWDHANYGAKMCLKGLVVMIIFGLVFYYTGPGSSKNKPDVSFTYSIESMYYGWDSNSII